MGNIPRLRTSLSSNFSSNFLLPFFLNCFLAKICWNWTTSGLVQEIKILKWNGPWKLVEKLWDKFLRMFPMTKILDFSFPQPNNLYWAVLATIWHKRNLALSYFTTNSKNFDNLLGIQAKSYRKRRKLRLVLTLKSTKLNPHSVRYDALRVGLGWMMHLSTSLSLQIFKFTTNFRQIAREGPTIRT